MVPRKMSLGYIVVLVTVPDEQTALTIANALVKERMAACVQVDQPITSIYSWKGAIEKDKEWRIVIKSREERFGEIKKVILEIHPYDVPQIIALPVVQGHEDYLTWIDDSLRDRPS